LKYCSKKALKHTKKCIFYLTVARSVFCFTGSGVFAVGNIDKGALLTYYEGELISKEEGDRRHENYEESDGSFLFFFKFKKKNFW
jgi:hypothetical protein